MLNLQEGYVSWGLEASVTNSSTNLSTESVNKL